MMPRSSSPSRDLAAAADELNPTPTPGGIRFNDRTIILGRSGSGKSELANYIATKPRCQILLYDTKDEFTVPGITPVY